MIRTSQKRARLAVGVPINLTNPSGKKTIGRVWKGEVERTLSVLWWTSQVSQRNLDQLAAALG